MKLECTCLAIGISHMINAAAPFMIDMYDVNSCPTSGYQTKGKYIYTAIQVSKYTTSNYIYMHLNDHPYGHHHLLNHNECLFKYLSKIDTLFSVYRIISSTEWGLAISRAIR